MIESIPDLTLVALLCLLIGILSYFLGRYFQKDCFDFYADFFISHKRFRSLKTQILYKDITHYDIDVNKGKHGTSYVLNLKTVDNQYFELSSESCSNHNEFRAISKLVTHRARRNKDCTDIASRRDYRTLGLGISFLSGLLLIFNLIINSDFKPEPPLSQNSIKSIVGTVARFEERHNKSSNWFILELREYPNFSFNIGGSAYKSLSSSSLKIDPIHTSDTLRLLITKRDYNYKIAQTIQPTWREFFDKYELIEPCQVEKATTQTVYYPLERYIQNGGHSYQEDGVDFRLLLVLTLLFGSAVVD